MDGISQKEMKIKMKIKIKIVHLVDDLKVGGLERSLAIVAENLDKAKYEVSVWCLLGEGKIADELKAKGIEVKVLNFSSAHKIRSLLKLTRWLRQEKVKIVHCWGLSAGVWGRVAAVIAGVLIRFSHVQNLYYDLVRKERCIEYILSFFTTQVIACSEAAKRCLIEFIGIKAEKITTIYNSVEIQKFSPKEDAKDVRKEFNLSEEDIIIGTVSRLVPVKGHIYLLNAAIKVLKEFPRVKFLIVGDGPLKAELKNKAEELGIKENVIFSGLREDIPRLVSAMNIFVQPSIIKEGLPLAIAEACAFALAVVASDIGGNSEIVQDQKTGILVSPADSDALARGLIFLLRNPDKAKEMGQAAQLLCKEKFSSETMMQKIEALYSSHLKNRS
jgi:glycosyltransferase involved in cell wall biosynthesis